MLSLIQGTGIRLIITITTGTDPLPCPITGQRVIMDPDLQIAEETELLLPLVHPPVRPIVRLQVHLIEHPQEFPTTVHPQEQLIDPLPQMFLQEEVAPGVVGVIAEEVVVE